MKKHLTKARAGACGRNLFLFLVMALGLLATDIFAQTYGVSLNQRRMGNQIGVEVWIKDVTANGTAPKLGNMSIAVNYNTQFLSPAAPTGSPSYSLFVTDSVDYNVNQINPYKTITSQFNEGIYGYYALQAQASDIGGQYVYQLDVKIPAGSEGYKPGTTGKGSFIGIIKFDIINHAALTSTSLTNIAINTATNIGDFRIFDVDGNDMESQTSLNQPATFTVKGITILNPNGPNEAVNRNKQFACLGFAGYPIYFERSGLVTPAVGSQYGSDALAYVVDYSTNNGSTWAAESFRVAETRKTVTELSTDGTDDLTASANGGAHYYGEISTSTNTDAGYVITQADGSQLPVESVPGFGGVLRVIWKADPYFAPRSEQARLRICQLATTGKDVNISVRTKPANTICKVSDYPFVLSRLFFLQLNGSVYGSCNNYLKTNENYSNSTQLTVEAWVNLNEYQADGTEPGIIVTSPGPAKPDEEGAWMLYLKDGKYPAFRAKEIIGGQGRGENNGAYIATVVSPDALTISADAFPINGNANHSQNWAHIAATVKNNVVSIYVNGELKAQKINNNAVDIRMATTEHPVWVGVNPNGGIDAVDFIHAGIKEVKIWRKALTQDQLRQVISGVPNPTDVSGNNAALEMYYSFVGIDNDLATDKLQNYANTITFYNVCGTTVSADNSLMKFRPDRAHVKLTAPVGGEGISNLQGNDFNVRWVGYGLGDNASSSTADLAIEFSRDGGNSWALAHDNQAVLPEGMPLDKVDIESATAVWEPYNNVNVVGSYLDLRGVVPPATQYSKNCFLRIRGTDANKQNDIYDVSGSFVVAPYFALKNVGKSIIAVPGASDLNLTGGSAMLEAWIRPYRFPTAQEQYFPIINKTDSTTNTTHYALRLLSTGQIQLVVNSNGNVLTANSDITKPVEEPNVKMLDSAWTHVAVFVNLANGSGNSFVLFYIDGNYQRVDSLTNQLGSNVAVNSTNTYPAFIGYEPAASAADGKYFYGEMKEIRFWNGVPAGLSYSGTEPTALTNFIRGALGVRSNELSASPVNYKANLVASFSFNGGAWVKTNYAYNGVYADNNATGNIQAQVIRSNGLSFVGVEPYIKLVEPTFLKQVPNTTKNLTVRWVGFDYGRNLGETGDRVASKKSDLEYSVWGGGETALTPYIATSSVYENASFDPNSLTLPSTNNYRFEGLAVPPAIQFAGSLDVSLANPDKLGDGSNSDRGAISATLTNARLRIRSRAEINTVSPLEYTTYRHLRSEGPLFTITPASNFTVRALLEGFHKGSGQTMTGSLGTTLATNGIKISLYENSGGLPGKLIKTAESDQGYSQVNPLSPIYKFDGSQFGNIPFVFTDVTDGDYFVLVEQTNHLPVMSRTVAPFKFSGDNLGTWAIESGWDFTTWNGVKNDATFSAWGYRETDPANTNYGATGLIYNNGQAGDTTQTQLTAMIGGDIVRDGQINAADRVKVRQDAGGATYASDVTGDGEVNATDRQIVDRNSNRISSVGDVFKKLYSPKIYPAGDIYEVSSDLDPAMAMKLNNEAKSFDENGKVVQAIDKSLEKVQTSGFQYTVTGETELKDGYVNLTMYIQNNGDDFAPANCTFAVKYDPNLLDYDKLANIETSLWSDNASKGYAGVIYSAPTSKAVNPMSDVRTIEIDYDNYTKKAGVLVPHVKTLLGTLKFKVRQGESTYNFSWYKSCAVYTTNGVEITANGDFQTIEPASSVRNLTVTAPNGGEVWKSGKSYSISWVVPTNEVQAFAEYSIDKGNTWTRINTQSFSSKLGSFDWTAANVNSTECLVRIVGFDGTEYDRSNNVFTIVPPVAQITRPAANDPVYSAGTKDVIRWSIEDVKTVKFEFSEDGTNNWKSVTTTVNSATGQVEWVVPMVNTKNAVIAMKDIATGQTIVSSEPFKVLIGKVTFISPSTGEALKVNSTKPVRWSSSNVSTFDLQYSLDNGTTWTSIEKGVNAGKATYSWLVPNQNSDNAIIRALYNNDPALEYARTATFRITGFVDVETPSQYEFSVDEPVPNPFGAETEINFVIPQAGSVYVSVYNAAGLKVADLINGAMMGAGANSVRFQAGNNPSGVYYVRITSGSNTAVKEVVIAR